ncbi:MAG: M43 family zinc metalloprotease [Brumimicrobium sp.]
MKNTLLFGALLLGSTTIAQDVSQIERCYSHKAIEYQESLTPGYEGHVDEQFEIAKNHQQTKTNRSSHYTIPVVVHIVHNTTDQNLADSVIHRQIETLNEDYQRKNADTVNMRSDFDIVKGSPNIHFMLAQVDPDGNPTTGITRTETSEESFGDFGLFTGDMSTLEKVKQTSEGGIDPWDQEKYLNIWVCNMSIMGSPMLLGFATPPSGLSNWPSGSVPNLSDGVVMQYQAFGDNNPNELDMGEGPINVRGRTTTHEVGHYLGLRHIWADGDCSKQDGIDDTPNADDQSEFDCDDTKNTCTDAIQGQDLPDMIENYMDYSAETCQNSFTQGQVDLMRGVLENQRYDLVHNNSASLSKNDIIATSLYPNPTDNSINITFSNGGADEVTIFDLNGKELLSIKDQKSSYKLDVSSFEKGIYFAKIMKDGVVLSNQKFIKL